MGFSATDTAPTRQRVTAGMLAGVAASIAYAIEQEVDLHLVGHYTDDLTLVGRLFTSDDSRIRPLGFAGHLLNGAIVGAVYAFLADRRLPGPPLARGVIFALAENVVLYPLALLERHHPAIREGTLASYWSRKAFYQQTLRHAAFGVVLGPLTERLLQGRR